MAGMFVGKEFIELCQRHLRHEFRLTGLALFVHASDISLTWNGVRCPITPRDMGYAWNGISYQQAVAGGGAGVFALSLVLVFLILAALYQSWSLPFGVLLSVPVAVCGTFLGLWAHGFDNDIYGQIGLIMLISLSAKKAILIVEFAKAELEKGKTIVEAALSGARLRLRPILMTSFAFIFGLVPLWYALGGGAAARRLIGTVTIVGMVFSSGIAIFLVPPLFAMVERLSHSTRRVRIEQETTEQPRQVVVPLTQQTSRQ
jgi:multidrug efflux pump subunit AcrB